MKCVKLSNGVIIRVHYREADKIVASGKGVFVSKTEWREWKNV
jgi:hypothetical protein